VAVRCQEMPFRGCSQRVGPLAAGGPRL